jgi:hypothetical protein
MGFRRDSERARSWDLWLNSHRDELMLAGVPFFVLESENRWWHFRAHGFDPVSKFSVRQLNAEQKQKLRQLLVREYGEDADLQCLGPRGPSPDLPNP